MLIYCTPCSSIHGMIASRTATIFEYGIFLRLPAFLPRKGMKMLVHLEICVMSQNRTRQTQDGALSYLDDTEKLFALHYECITPDVE